MAKAKGQSYYKNRKAQEAQKAYEKAAKTTKLGQAGGKRFKAIEAKARASGAENPAAVAAAAGIKAHGKAKMAKWAQAGKKAK